jgi:hypothetical protein
MTIAEKGFLSSFYSHFEKNTSAIKRRSDLKELKQTLETALERQATWVLSSSFSTTESDEGKFLIVLDESGFHILNKETHAHTLIENSGHFQSKVGSLSIPVSLSIIEQDFFAWLSLHEKSLIIHSTAKNSQVPKKAIKDQDVFATEALASFGITLDTPLTSAKKTQSLIMPVQAFVTTLSTSIATTIVETPENIATVAEETIINEESETVVLKKESTKNTETASYLLTHDIENFVKTEQIVVGGVTCQFSCLLDLSLAFHHSNGLRRLASTMEVLFLGIPCKQEKGEIIREPISSKWSDVTKALQTLSQTLYTLKNTLDIENAQKILRQIPKLSKEERARLLEFSKAAYSFVSWYRSGFEFSLAQQDTWEKVTQTLISEPHHVNFKTEAQAEKEAQPIKAKKIQKKKEAKEAVLEKEIVLTPYDSREEMPQKVTPKILSLRKLV